MSLSEDAENKLSILVFAALVAVIALLPACGEGGTAAPSIPTPTPGPATRLVPMGLDYGLKRQCIRTPYPDESNFYVDNVDCPGGAYPTSHYWNTVAEIEIRKQAGVALV